MDTQVAKIRQMVRRKRKLALQCGHPVEVGVQAPESLADKRYPIHV